MSSQRSERAWIPAAVASIALVLGLFAAWALNKASGGNASAPGDLDASLWRWLLATNNQFFGAEPFSGTGRILAGTVAGVVVLLAVAYVGTWWALRGQRPGSALLPAFLATWMVLVVAAIVAAGVRWAVAAPDLSFPGAGRVQYSVLTGGALSGLRLGWVAALLGTLAWLAVRPPADASPDLAWDHDELEREEADREFVMKRRSDFNLEDGVGTQRNAETLGRREGDRPVGEPVPAPGPTYVGRRSSGQYAEDDEESPAPPSTSGGSHRG